MNKKLFLLLTVAPILSSCSGFPISKDDALRIAGTIEANLSEDFSHSDFNITSVSKSSNGSLEITDTNVYIYSVESKFYHTYRVYESSDPYNRGTVYESWKYVKDAVDSKDKENKTWIFDVTRVISQSIYIDDKQYNYIVSYELFTEEAWENAVDGYEKKLIVVPIQNALTRTKELIANESYDVDVFSFNGDSLALNAKREIEEDASQVNTYSMNIFNNRLLSTYSSNSSTTEETVSNSFQETIYKYSAGDIYYPEIDITVSSI